MKRTTKRYVVSTSALNCYGYRVLTDGIELAQFLKNPVVFWIHKKGEVKLPLGKAVDIQRDGDTISCAIDFTEAHPFAVQAYEMYQDGTLCMMSLGAEPLEISTDPADMLPGQTGVTVTRCKAIEFSCCDIGGNDEALSCELYDANEKPITLDALMGEAYIALHKPLTQTKNDDTPNMKKIELTGEALAGILLNLKLTDAANDVQVQKAVADLIQLNKEQETEVVKLKTELEHEKAEIIKLIALSSDEKIERVLDENKDKFLPAKREHFKKLLQLSFDEAKALIDELPAPKSVAEVIALNKGKGTDKMLELSYDELDKSGQLPKLKAENIELFKQKFEEKYGTEYKGA